MLSCGRWFGSLPTPFPPLTQASCLSFSVFPVCRRSRLLTEEGGGGSMGKDPNHTTTGKSGPLQIIQYFCFSSTRDVSILHTVFFIANPNLGVSHFLRKFRIRASFGSFAKRKKNELHIIYHQADTLYRISHCLVFYNYYCTSCWATMCSHFSHLYIAHLSLAYRYNNLNPPKSPQYRHQSPS